MTELDTGLPEHRGFLKAFLYLLTAGAVGLVSLPLVVQPQLERLQEMPGAPELPRFALSALMLVQPALLLIAAVLVGLHLAPRLGLHSHIVARARRQEKDARPFLKEVPGAFAAGLLVAAAVVVIDIAFAPLLGEEWDAARRAQPEGPLITLAGMLYGGLTEEILLRWGVVTLLAWLLWRISGRRRPVAAWIMIFAIVVAAVLFGIGHLPAVSLLLPLQPALIVRTVLLNAIAGVIFGWLYWRRSLEAAMVAHAAGHLVFALAA